jgi:hypothetical protein
MRQTRHYKIGAMMRPYRLFTYGLQVLAVLMIFAALPLQWHTEQGTGLQVLDRALRITIPFGLSNPFDPEEIPASEWWIVWAIPLVSAAVGLRALTGFMFTELKGQRWIVLLLCLGLFVGFGWYYANFSEDVQIGFYLDVAAGAGLFLGLLLELALPKVSIQERRLLHLPPNHPARVEAGYSRACTHCGEYNELDSRQCTNCGIVLYPEPIA